MKPLTPFQEMYYHCICPHFPNEMSKLIAQFLEFYPNKNILNGNMEILCCIISQTDRFLVASSTDGYIRFWNVELGRCFKILKINDVISLQLSFDDQLLAARTKDHGVTLWNVKQASLLHTINHDDCVNASSLAHNKEFIVTGCFGGKLYMDDVKTGTLMHIFEHKSKNDTGPVLCCDVSHNCKFILASYLDHTLKLFHIKTGNLVQTFNGHTDFASQCIFFNHTNKFISSGNDGTLRIWNFDEDKFDLENTTVNYAYYGPILKTKLSFDDECILTLNFNGTIQFLDGQTGKKFANCRIQDCTDCCVTSDRTYLIKSYATGEIEITKLTEFE